MKIVIPLLLTLITLVGCEQDTDCEKSASCSLDPDPGFCKAYIKRYYYDQTEKKCKEFIWGGCDGVVPFETLEECKQCECMQPVN
jgi:hypothetical protein